MINRTSFTSLKNTINGENMSDFLKEVNEKIGGVPIQMCYHCRKCTAGCPLAFAMEYNPNKIIKLIQMGRRDEVLASSTIWLCASCETCVTRCPNDVDIARMMDTLREMAIESNVAVKEKNILKFHEAFLSSIKRGGRINEPFMIADYKLKSGDYFSDIRLGLSMFIKGKLSLFSPKTKDMASVRKIFKETKA
jgi:heterodisulfide reductase subunit C